MRCILLIASLAFSWTSSAEVTRISTPTLGIVADPASGRLIAIEGVRGRLNLGRVLWPTAVQAAWPAAGSRALVQVDGSWRLLEWNRDWAMTRTIELGVQDWARVVWNAEGSAWLACGDLKPGCAIYRASDGAVSRKIDLEERLSAVALADNATEAILRRGNVAFIWARNNEITALAEGVSAAAFRPGESRLAVVQETGSLLLLDAAAPNPGQIETTEGAVGAAWAPNGQWLLVAYRDGQIRIFDDSGQVSGIANCDCVPGGVWQMGRSGLFRLQENTKQQIFVVGIENGAIQFSILPSQEQEVR